MNTEPKGKLMDAGTIMRELGINEHAAQAFLRAADTDGDGLCARDEAHAFIERNTVTPEQERAALTSIYIAYDKRGVCLYVGITGARLQRLHAHQKAAKWWRKASTITLEHYGSRQEAEAREVELIRELRPKHNIVHMVVV